jgi:hypothetical protein
LILTPFKYFKVIQEVSSWFPKPSQIKDWAAVADEDKLT